jgi:hypothetical protein
VLALRRQGLEGQVGHPHDRETIPMMAWLEAGAGLMVAALALVRWLGSHMQLIWRYGPQRRAAVTATATVIRRLPAVRAELSPARRIIRGEIIPREDHR